MLRNCAVRGALCRLRFELWQPADEGNEGERLLYQSEATATATASPEWRSVEWRDAAAYRARAVAVRVFASRAGRGWERVAERVVTLAHTECVAAAAEMDALSARQPFALLLVGHGAVYVPAEERSTVLPPAPAPAPAHTPPAHSPSPSASSASPAESALTGAWPPAARSTSSGNGGSSSGSGGGTRRGRTRPCSYAAETLVQLLCAEEACAAQEAATAAARAALARALAPPLSDDGAGAPSVQERDELRARVAHLEQELREQQALLREDTAALARAQETVAAGGAELLVHERRLCEAATRLAAADGVRARCAAEARRVEAFVARVQWRLVNSLQLAYPVVQTRSAAPSRTAPDLPFINALDAPDQPSPRGKAAGPSAVPSSASASSSSASFSSPQRRANASAVAVSEARGLNEEDLLTGMSSTISDFSSFTDALADADALSRSFLNREPPYAVCGIELDEDFFAGEEQDLAAALGHCCHILVLISSFLDVCAFPIFNACLFISLHLVATDPADVPRVPARHRVLHRGLATPPKPCHVCLSPFFHPSLFSFIICVFAPPSLLTGCRCTRGEWTRTALRWAWTSCDETSCCCCAALGRASATRGGPSASNAFCTTSARSTSTRPRSVRKSRSGLCGPRGSERPASLSRFA